MWADCGNIFIAKNTKNDLKHEKQRHLVSKMQFEIFFIKAQDPFHKYTAVFERCYFLVKSSFFGISTPKDDLEKL